MLQAENAGVLKDPCVSCSYAKKADGQNDEGIENKQDVVKERGFLYGESNKKEMGKRTLIFLGWVSVEFARGGSRDKGKPRHVADFPDSVCAQFKLSGFAEHVYYFFQPFADHAASCAVKKKLSSCAAAANSGVAAVWLFD